MTNMEISLPDRYDMLKRKADSHLSEIISPVEDSLTHLDFLFSEMKASSRGQFLILRGDSGTGKSTFIHTIGLFRQDVEALGARKVGGKVGSNSVAAFEKLSDIAASNDVALNRAFAECLKATGVITSYEVEQDFGNGLTRRTDIVAQTVDGPVRLEMMWRKKTGRAAIANYVLQKLFNYGKAVGYLN